MKLLVLVAMALTLSGCAGCGERYSSGERLGVVRKISNKGLLWKSWEGEALLTVPGTESAAMQPEVFGFNVDPSAVAKVQEAAKSGRRVELVYRQWWMPPASIESPYVVVDVRDPGMVQR